MVLEILVEQVISVAVQVVVLVKVRSVYLAYSIGRRLLLAPVVYMWFLWVNWYPSKP